MTDHPADQAELIAAASPPEASPAAQCQGTSVRHAGVQLLQVLALSALFAASFVGWAWWQADSLALAWPYLQCQRLFFDPLHVVIKDAPGGTIIERPVRVLNRSSSVVTLLGSQPTCDCVTLDEFPIEIPAGRDHTLTLKIGVSSKPGPDQQSIKIFTDHDNPSNFAVTVTATAR